MGESNERKDVTYKSFRGNPDYKTEFTAAVDEIINANTSDRQARITAIDALCEEYTVAVGEIPDSRQLQRLANEILREELTDKHPDKITREEYPIMSEHQVKRRNKKAITTPNMYTDNTMLGYKKIHTEDRNGGIVVKKQEIRQHAIKPN